MASLTTGAIIGIAVGGTVAVLIAASILVLLHIRDRERLTQAIPMSTREHRHSRFITSWIKRDTKNMPNLREAVKPKNKGKLRAAGISASSDSEASLTSLGVDKRLTVASGKDIESPAPVYPLQAVLLARENGLPQVNVEATSSPLFPSGDEAHQEGQPSSSNTKRYSQLRGETWNRQQPKTDAASPSLSELIRDFGNVDNVGGNRNSAVRNSAIASHRTSLAPMDSRPVSTNLTPIADVLPLASIEKHAEKIRRESTMLGQPYISPHDQLLNDPPPHPNLFPSTSTYGTSYNESNRHSLQAGPSILTRNSGIAPDMPPPPLPRGAPRGSIFLAPKPLEGQVAAVAVSEKLANESPVDPILQQQEQSYGPGIGMPFNATTASPTTTVSRNSSIFGDAETWDTSPSIGLTSPFRTSRQGSASQGASDANGSCPNSESSTDYRRKSSGRRFLRGTSVCTLAGVNVDRLNGQSPGYTDIIGEYSLAEQPSSAGDRFSSQISPRNSTFQSKRKHRMSNPETVSRFSEQFVPLTDEQRDIVRAYRMQSRESSDMASREISTLSDRLACSGPLSKSIPHQQGTHGQMVKGSHRRRASLAVNGDERHNPPDLSPIVASEAATPMLPEKSNRRSQFLEDIPAHPGSATPINLEAGFLSRFKGWAYGPASSDEPTGKPSRGLGSRKTSSVYSEDIPPTPRVPSGLGPPIDLGESQCKLRLSAPPVSVFTSPFVLARPKPPTTNKPANIDVASASAPISARNSTVVSTPKSTRSERPKTRTRPEIVSAADMFASFPALPKIPAAYLRESKVQSKVPAVQSIAEAPSSHKIDSGSEEEGRKERKVAAEEKALSKLEGRSTSPTAALSDSSTSGMSSLNRMAAGMSAVERLEQRRKMRREQMMSSTGGSIRRQKGADAREDKGKQRATGPVTPPGQIGKARHGQSRSVDDHVEGQVGLGLSTWS